MALPQEDKNPTTANTVDSGALRPETAAAAVVDGEGAVAPALFRDPWLEPFREVYRERQEFVAQRRNQLLDFRGVKTLREAADWHETYGFHRLPNGTWRFREWLPNATAACLLGEFNQWTSSPWFELHPVPGTEDWQAEIPGELMQEGQSCQLFVEWPGGQGWRLPTAASQVRREVQGNGNVLFNAVVREETREYPWQHDDFRPAPQMLVYEAHVGIAQEEPRVGTYREFTEKTLPRIAKEGYTCLQLMAVAQHPYYASFGYHVANFFAPEELFGSPEDLKALVDAAHGMGIRVVMDLVHSHAVKNELEGLGNLCGRRDQFFHDGPRGEHPAWNSYCFNYGKPQVARFLLSNCRYWLEEFHLDGFRFDGVTSMLYFDHGLGHPFQGYQDYFGPNVDWDSVAYLTMANELCHQLDRPAITIAEDISGMPGLALSVQEGGIGFDYRLAMGITDLWFKLLDRPDEYWDMGALWYELTNCRKEEQTLSYVECHDQALVGGQTFLFRCLGNAMYQAMDRQSQNLLVDRGIALHKMARLVTATTAKSGYLNFMGNEFGHPEWLDFPREGNGWSYDHARRRWDLADDPNLRFSSLLAFDHAMIELLRRHPHFFRTTPEYRLVDQERHLIVFERDGLLLAFNFHPTQSYQDLKLPCQGNEYALVLDSDAKPYDGFGRIQPGQHFYNCAPQGEYRYLSVYLPCRTAVVLECMDGFQGASGPRA